MIWVHQLHRSAWKRLDEAEGTRLAFKRIMSRNRSLPTDQSLSSDRPRVIVIDDDDDLRELLADALREDGFDVVLGQSGTDLVDYFNGARDGQLVLRPRLIISDECMPRCTGTQALEHLQGLPLPPFVLMSAFSDDTTRNRASSLGAAAVIDKPIDMDDFRTLVWNLMEAS